MIDENPGLLFLQITAAKRLSSFRRKIIDIYRNERVEGFCVYFGAVLR